MNKRTRTLVVKELEGAELGDRRRNERLEKVVDRLAHRPSASLPHALVTEAELEGAYRFLNSDAVGLQDVLRPHSDATVARCSHLSRVLLLHDTTAFTFGGQSRRKGLGKLSDGGQGFFGHFCLAATSEGVPLGVLGLKTYAREKKVKRTRSKSTKRPERESLRWAALALEVGPLLPDAMTAIHVMDSEADDYELFAALAGAGQDFVIRTAQNRNVEEPDADKLFEALEGAEHRFKREVPLSERRAKQRGRSSSKRNQPRKQRTATLEIRTRSIEVRRPQKCTSEVPKTLTLNYVHVREVNVPEGEEAVDWVLVTSQPIRTKGDVERIVDAYRARWLIEEFFRALKSGCEIEQAQLESLAALETYLAMLCPVAWRLLLTKTLQKDWGDAPAELILTEDEIEALRVLTDEKLPKRLTVAAATLAVARLGGHIKRNGAPGWIVLGRAMQQLRDGAEMLKALKNKGKL
jgi:hypothetical protein